MEVEEHRRRPGRPGRVPQTALLPSAVSYAWTSWMPTPSNAWIVQSTIFWHSSGGNCLASATDLKATACARSSHACGIKPLTRSRRASTDTVRP